MWEKSKTSLTCRNAGRLALAGLLLASFASAQRPSPLNVRVTPGEITGGTGSINVLVTFARLMSPQTVTLTSSAPAAASVPASVVVPSGASSFSYTVTTSAVARDTAVRIAASVSNVALPGGDASLTVFAPALVAFTISPATIVGGNPPSPPYDPMHPVVHIPVMAKGTITLNAAVAEDTPFTLTTSDPAAMVPSPASVRAKQKTAVFIISTTHVSAATLVRISVQLGTKTLPAYLKVTP